MRLFSFILLLFSFILITTTTSQVLASKIFSFGENQPSRVVLRSGHILPNNPLTHVVAWQNYKVKQWQDFHSLLKSFDSSFISTSTQRFLKQRTSIDWTKYNHKEDEAVQIFFTVDSLDHKKLIVERFQNSFLSEIHRVSKNVYSTVIKAAMIPSLSETASFVSYVAPEHKTKLSFKKTNSITKTETNGNLPPFSNILEQQQQKKNENNFSDNDDISVDLSIRVSDSNLSEEWIDTFKTFFPDSKINLINRNRITVSTHSRHAQLVLEFLKLQEDVTWIERKLFFQSFNAAGHSVVQIGPSAAEEQPNTPIWEHGITGKGQIVGVGDTGIDWDNCFFYDPEHPVPFNTIDKSHRKIISYNTMKIQNGISTDKKDGINGHGTHVCGSIAGSIITDHSNNNTDDVQELKKFNGVAPDSKLYFADIESGDVSGLAVPEDLQEQYFKPAYDAGARIHSNSWGCSFPPLFCVYDCVCVWISNYDGHTPGEPASDEYCESHFGAPCCTICNTYSNEALDIDTFVHDNDDMLILYAAGNDGGKSSSHSVSSPAVAKNALAVGASESTNENYKRTLEFQDWKTNAKAQGFSSVDQCCSFSQRELPYWEFMIHTSCCKNFVQQLATSSDTIINAANVAAFSSRGPTYDNRVKPEVLAPGHNVHSMHSDGNTSSFQCGDIAPHGDNSAAIISMRGTSMSTPTAAGAAALVRQYLVDGFYPSGETNPDDAMDSPSAALIKAILIHSTEQKVSSTYRGDMKRIDVGPKYPNNIAGYGILNLASVLQFSDSDFDLYLDTLEIQNRKQHTFTINAPFDDFDQSNTFKVTLVWNDPPSGPQAESALVNNLDLILEHTQTESGAIKKYFGNGQNHPDTVNNVEQVMTTNVKANDTIRIHVNGEHIEDAQQRYSIVMTGQFINVTSPEISDLPEGLRLGRQGALVVIFSIASIFVLGLVTVFIIRDKTSSRQPSSPSATFDYYE
eukprot:gb/GECH01005287.1/.p1 GENE.gb/GECH01005287.1/~~gb/GECH01005287.1/.p1  ORF type:complete len:967 (+),score=205.39 gb/GECH01005287.1/:1-2901(+)